MHYVYCFRNNNAIAAELLEKYMKRLSDSARTATENLHRLSLEDDPESPLYASPTAYGYAKIGAYSRRTTPARDSVSPTNSTSCGGGEGVTGSGQLQELVSIIACNTPMYCSVKCPLYIVIG